MLRLGVDKIVTVGPASNHATQQGECSGAHGRSGSESYRRVLQWSRRINALCGNASYMDLLRLSAAYRVKSQFDGLTPRHYFADPPLSGHCPPPYMRCRALGLTAASTGTLTLRLGRDIGSAPRRDA